MCVECLLAPSLRLSLQPAFCCFPIKPVLIPITPILTRLLAHASLARSIVTEAHPLCAHWTSLWAVGPGLQEFAEQGREHQPCLTLGAEAHSHPELQDNYHPPFTNEETGPHI